MAVQSKATPCNRLKRRSREITKLQFLEELYLVLLSRIPMRNNVKWVLEECMNAFPSLRSSDNSFQPVKGVTLQEVVRLIHHYRYICYKRRHTSISMKPRPLDTVTPTPAEAAVTIQRWHRHNHYTFSTYKLDESVIKAAYIGGNIPLCKYKQLFEYFWKLRFDRYKSNFWKLRFDRYKIKPKPTPTEAAVRIQRWYQYHLHSNKPAIKFKLQKHRVFGIKVSTKLVDPLKIEPHDTDMVKLQKLVQSSERLIQSNNRLLESLLKKPRPLDTG